MKEAIKERVVRHGEDLKVLFNLPKEVNSLQLCRKLRRIESMAHKLMENQCNGDTIATDEQQQKEEQEFLNSVNELLDFRKQKIPVFLNGDPRGYILKIEDDFCKDKKIHRDMGGYGIIAPDLSEE